jgi:hypothetical protein
MMPVLHRCRAALAEVVIHDVLIMKIRSCAQPIFEVQPGEDLDLVQYTGLPNAAAVDISRAMVGVDCVVGIAGCVWFAGQLQDFSIGAFSETEILQT